MTARSARLHRAADCPSAILAPKIASAKAELSFYSARFIPLLVFLLLGSSVPHLNAGQITLEKRVTLSGNVHPLARAEYDRGVAPDTLPMDRMQLLLKQTPGQQADLKKFLADLQDRSSPIFHKWLTPAQFGVRFGASQAAIEQVSNWLIARGFAVNKVSAGRTVIEFSGVAGQVRDAFTTEIHRYVVQGEEHWANAGDIQIPANLASLVTGVATLHNFYAKPQHTVADQVFTARLSSGPNPKPQFTVGSRNALAPADVQLIYNAGFPAYQPTDFDEVIGIVGRTNIDVQDVRDFFTAFALSSPAPSVIVNGPDPGNLGGGEEREALLDVTWSGAMDRNARVDLVVSQSTNSTDGVELSELYLIDNNIADIMSESFGACEAVFTAAQEQFTSVLAEQAAAQGITYLVSSGDSGSAGCDDPSVSPATGPVSVNGLASTPFNLAIGGTQFNENGTPANYWNTVTAPNGESALSYIPEDVWNQSGATSIPAGGGGRSVFFPKPVWQAGVQGIPADNARDVPDISFSAAVHDPYLLCVNGSCHPSSPGGQISFEGVGGTSASTPVFAGMLAKVNDYLSFQANNSSLRRQGQIGPVLYALASSENLAQCNGSSIASPPASQCIFNDVTVGNNAVPGQTGSVKYPAGTGYDLASGLGSINVYNLAQAWSAIGGSVAPVLSTVNIGSEPVGSSLQSFVTVNIQGATETPSFALRYGVEFQIVNQSCLSLPTGEQCVLTVNFSPNLAGLRSDVLTASLGLQSPQVITLTGIGTAPQISLTPGQITTLAGNGATGFQGDGGSAIAASFSNPNGIAIDPTGNIYIADTANNRIRRVDAASGLVTTVAGTGVAGSGGDGGTAAQAQLNQPQAVALDLAGNLFIGDTGNFIVRRVDRLTGEITTVVGDGTYGFSGNPSPHSFGMPVALTVDPNGILYICDAAFPSVWILQNRALSLLAGTGAKGDVGSISSVGGIVLGYPAAIAVGPDGSTYIADAANNTVWEITAGLAYEIPFAGTGTAGYSGDFGPATRAELNAPSGLAVDAAGNVYISDSGNGVIRVVTALNSLIATIAGNQALTLSSGDGGPSNLAGLGTPKSIALDGAGNLFMSTGANVLREITSNPGLLRFPATLPGATSMAQTAFALNIGNEPFSFTASDVPAGFLESDFNSFTSCFSSGILLAAGDLCAVGVEEQPQSQTAPSGFIDITGNNLNQIGSRRQILLNPPTGTFDGWLVDIDVPALPDDPIQGPLMFSGWAFDNKSAMANVQLAIDGYPIGQAFYGAFRPDVCAIYTGEPGCPSVGWSLIYNTQLLADGDHLLQVTATAADGSHSVAARTFQVANWSTNNPTHIDFDYPGGGGVNFSGTASFGGWVIDDNAPVTNVAIAVDGSPAGNATYDIYRADVCALFPGGPGCPNVGWSFHLDTRRLSNGPHALQLTATINNDRKSTATAQFNVSNPGPVQTNPVHINIDTPGPLTAPLSGNATVSGWAVADLSAIANVAIFVDGAFAGNAQYGIYRSDVCAVLPGRPGCPGVGWTYALDTTALTNGVHTLSITASSTAAASEATAQITFTVNNTFAAFHLDIDVPSALSGPVTGLAQFIGWAFNDNGPIAAVTYSIDGAPYGLASYGEYRADVCAVFPGRAGCPGIGWFVLLDTGTLADGLHTLAITAYSGAAHRTVSTTFTVANWSAVNPIRLSVDAPAVNQTLSGSEGIFGWALDTAEQVKQVTYALDGALQGTAFYGAYRADACAVYGNAPGCPSIGWSASLDTTRFTNGTHTLDITITSVGGVSYTQSTPVVIAN